MNLKLLSLMKKAGFVFWEDEDWKPENAVIDWATNYDKEIEKFAELIVQECIRLCDQVDYVGADECMDNIKQHFGIEE